MTIKINAMLVTVMSSILVDLFMQVKISSVAEDTKCW